MVIKIVLITLVGIFYFTYLRKRKQNAKQISVAIILAVVLASSCLGGDKDSDGDGVIDKEDDFPHDATQWKDFDKDGFGDNPKGNNPDAFPQEPTQWLDKDKDGYGDNPLGNNTDVFPTDPLEWKDTDRDGLGDNRDELPKKATDLLPGDNAMIRLTILHYEGHRKNDRNGADPIFTSRIDYGDQGTWDYTANSGVFWNAAELYDYVLWTVDINDAYLTIRFDIQVFETNWLNVTDILDMNPDPNYNSMIHVVKAPLHYQWNFIGNETEGYCNITYLLETVNERTNKVVNPDAWSQSVSNVSENRVYHTGASIVGIPLINYGYIIGGFTIVGISLRLRLWRRMKGSNWTPPEDEERVEVEIVALEPELVEDADYKVIR